MSTPTSAFISTWSFSDSSSLNSSIAICWNIGLRTSAIVTTKVAIIRKMSIHALLPEYLSRREIVFPRFFGFSRLIRAFIPPGPPGPPPGRRFILTSCLSGAFCSAISSHLLQDSVAGKRKYRGRSRLF